MHSGRITATEVAKARRWSSPHRRVRNGTSTMPPPPPKKPLAMPASPPATAGASQARFRSIKKHPPIGLSLPMGGCFIPSTGRKRLSPDAGQVPDYLAGQQQSGGGGDPHYAGGDAAAAGGWGFRLSRPAGLLWGPDYLVVTDAPSAQLSANHPGQRAALGLFDVADPEQRGVQLVAGAQGGEDGDLPFQGGLD